MKQITVYIYSIKILIQYKINKISYLILNNKLATTYQVNNIINANVFFDKNNF